MRMGARLEWCPVMPAFISLIACQALPPCALSGQNFVGNSFCFFAQPCCFGAFNGILQEFSVVSDFVF
jgi:hypothetical protein